MSTFTDFGGCSNNTRASDLIALTKAYQDLLSELKAHISNKPGDSNVHDSKIYIDNVLSYYVKLADFENKINSYYSKIETDNIFARKTDVPDITNKADMSALELKADKSELSEYLKTAELDNNTVIQNINNSVSNINDKLNKLSKTANGYKFDGEIEASKILTNEIVSKIEKLEFNTVQAYVGGSDDKGVYYIICELSDVSGTVFCDFHNDISMSAVIDFAVRPNDGDTIGSLSVTCANNSIIGLGFKIVEGTGIDSVKRYYLAARADAWVPLFTSTDGVGYHKFIEFTVTGIGIAVDYVKPNGSCIIVVECDADTGHSSNKYNLKEILTDEVKTKDGKNIFKIVEEGGLVFLLVGDENISSFNLKTRPYLIDINGTKSPFLSAKDISVLDDVGTIHAWCEYDADGKAINYPPYCLACDGTQFDENNYPDLFTTLGKNTLPLVDYFVIKALSVIDIIDKYSFEGGSLAAAVASLHDTGVYMSADDLPLTAQTGAFAIVHRDGLYYVYEKTDMGWEIKQ